MKIFKQQSLVLNRAPIANHHLTPIRVEIVVHRTESKAYFNIQGYLKIQGITTTVANQITITFHVGAIVDSKHLHFL